MNQKIIAILEDDGVRKRAMEEVLKPFSHEVLFFEVAKKMVDWLKENLHQSHLISLDHDLGPSFVQNGKMVDPENGRVVVEYLSLQSPACPVIIHTANSIAGSGMEFRLIESGWKVERVYPMEDLEWIHLYWLELVTNFIKSGT